MSKFLFCAECAKRLEVTRHAVVKLGRIIDVVTPHVCTEQPVEFDFSETVTIPQFITTAKGKFDRKLNELDGTKDEMDLRGFLPGTELGDKRPLDSVKTDAPSAILAELMAKKEGK